MHNDPLTTARQMIHDDTVDAFWWSRLQTLYRHTQARDTNLSSVLHDYIAQHTPSLPYPWNISHPLDSTPNTHTRLLLSKALHTWPTEHTQAQEHLQATLQTIHTLYGIPLGLSLQSNNLRIQYSTDTHTDPDHQPHENDPDNPSQSSPHALILSPDAIYDAPKLDSSIFPRGSRINTILSALRKGANLYKRFGQGTSLFFTHTTDGLRIAATQQPAQILTALIRDNTAETRTEALRRSLRFTSTHEDHLDLLTAHPRLSFPLTLNDLYERMKAGDWTDWTRTPDFGGKRPTSLRTPVWAWDSRYAITGHHSKNVRLASY